jgi:hypothetical protein
MSGRKKSPDKFPPSSIKCAPFKNKSPRYGMQRYVILQKTTSNRILITSRSIFLKNFNSIRRALFPSIGMHKPHNYFLFLLTKQQNTW